MLTLNSLIQRLKNYDSPHAVGFLLLAILIPIWGFSWPIMKIALADISPLWMAFTRLMIGTLCLFLYLLFTKKLRLPTKQDIPNLLWIGILQMTGFMVLSTIGLMYVPASRSAILAYTTPLWVTPIAVLWFKEPLPLSRMIGLCLGLLGVFVLFNPASFDWSDPNVVLGNGLLILAAIAWAICIVQTRFTQWHLTPLQLLPWQMLLASILIFFMAISFESFSDINWSFNLISLLFYIGPIGTALGVWIVIEVSRRLPAVTTSLCMLGVPILGLFSSHLLLGEPITINMIASITLITLGLVFVIKAKVKNKVTSSKN